MKDLQTAYGDAVISLERTHMDEPTVAIRVATGFIVDITIQQFRDLHNASVLFSSGLTSATIEDARTKRESAATK